VFSLSRPQGRLFFVLSQKNTPVKNVVQEQLTLELSPSGRGQGEGESNKF
jgi:hypothetical protein